MKTSTEKWSDPELACAVSPVVELIILEDKN